MLNLTRVDGELGTVVFLHGLFGQGRNFTTIAKSLQPSYASLLVDLPNHGGSDRSERVDYADMADAVADTIRAQSAPSPVAVVGHSMGGKVAMVLALRHPDLIDALAVVDIAPGPSEGGSEFRQLLDALASVQLSSLERRSDADAQLRALIPNNTVRQFLLQNLRHRDGAFGWQANLTLLRSELDDIGSFPDLGPDAAYDGPVLWIAGDRSDYVQDKHVPAMRALFPRYRKVVVKNSGHWVHSEQPTVFLGIIKQFLRTITQEQTGR